MATKMMTKRLRLGWHKLLEAVDSEAMILIQVVFDTMFIAAGIYGLFIAHGRPPITLRGSMTPINVHLWYWLNIIGPSTGLIGKTLRNTSFSYSGMWLRLAGHVTFALALMTYISATFEVEPWGRGMYGAFPLGTATLLSLLLWIVRDVRRLTQVERQVRNAKENERRRDERCSRNEE